MDLNGTFTAASGTPLTAHRRRKPIQYRRHRRRSASLRAEATGLPITGASNPYFNLAGLHHASAGPIRQRGRDTIPGPFQTSFNASLNRAFRFGETPPATAAPL